MWFVVSDEEIEYCFRQGMPIPNKVQIITMREHIVLIGSNKERFFWSEDKYCFVTRDTIEKIIYSRLESL